MVVTSNWEKPGNVAHTSKAESFIGLSWGTGNEMLVTYTINILSESHEVLSRKKKKDY